MRCTNCEEPWEADHIKFDAIYETDLDEQTIKDFREWRDGDNKDQFKLYPYIRKAFKDIGYVFGESLYHIIQCPCCKANGSTKDKELSDKVKTVCSLLGDDLDGIESTLEDLEG